MMFAQYSKMIIVYLGGLEISAEYQIKCAELSEARVDSQLKRLILIIIA